ncbi:hypothetical protein GOP47_0020760 [Adiantum capillus-veneris]|uniref:Uncharacterized protein n=1 Tax=Adiantum capillus-veneris TaxID=13818 RepID=A0A9D4Z7R9_ADICA|nr:hypothetical protein GOP47_0020760 [Adiantum capillus-veneris]
MNEALSTSDAVGQKKSVEQGVRDFVQQPHISNASQLLAGGVAGAVSKTCTAPLARLTILFQVEGMQSKAATLNRPSIIREAYRIAVEEGFKAFWKGNGVTIVHRLPYSSISFYAYEKYKMALLCMYSTEEQAGSLGVGMSTRLIAGGAAGITAASLTYPLDLVRTRLAAQRNEKYYKGIAHALHTITRDEGPRGLYKGLGATLLGVGPNIAINFCVYETLKSLWTEQRSELPGVWSSLAFGSVAGIASSTATFPLDLVRRRMQLEGAGGNFPVYKTGVLGTFVHIRKTEGWKGLYRGILPEYLKVVPSVGIVFMTYEFMKSRLTSHSDG